ncbi:hypothetical protein McpAg1_09050 [Methanocorpusculaceae archaeon Ag1]|uniref:Uncharacterized protein n=1 Tax=Methanorbis furvi TaxID=3028299 RepID=A0AAE4MAR6_9EURY|nr:hypothetical protein [Methanocorpusculaceae archaeon Ag1]
MLIGLVTSGNYEKKNRHGFTQMFNLPIAVILRSGGTPANRLRPFHPHWITAGKFFRFFVEVASVIFSYFTHSHSSENTISVNLQLLFFQIKPHVPLNKKPKKFASHYPVRAKRTEAISRSPDRTQDNDDWQIWNPCESVAIFFSRGNTSSLNSTPRNSYLNLFPGVTRTELFTPHPIPHFY